MQLTRLRPAPHVSMVAYRCLLQALRQCGVSHESVLPEEAPGSITRGVASSFAPLFTTKFDFQQHQLTALGDSLVDRYLSAALLQYCTRRGAVLTTNAAAEVNAVLHNHFTLRLFARELQFEALSMAPEQDVVGTDTASLDFLEPECDPLRRQDFAGTSHQVALLACGQSPLGWKFSQFVGAVHQTFGRDAAMRVLEHVYQLNSHPSVPRRASLLLLRALEHFPATGVAEAVLAAQGLAVHYSARSRVLPAAADEAAAGSGAPSSSRSARDGPAGERRHMEEVAIVSGFDVTRAPAGDVTLDRLNESSLRAARLSNGPGLVDAVDVWRRRTAALVSRQLEPAQEAAQLLTPSSVDSDGWLSAAEKATYSRGPAFAGWVDFSVCTTYADVYGPAQPENGRIVRRTKFKKAVRDPRFYDTLSDARNGVPFDTNGETLSDYLDAFSRSHQRLFEVTMQAGRGGEMRLVGRAISQRYTTARESAARAFLGGVLRDVAALEGGDATESSAQHSQK